MKSRRPLIIPLILGGTLFSQETRVRMQELPEVVQKTVKEQTKSAKLRGLAKEVEKGQTFYEAETLVNGKTRDVLIDAKGNVVEIEEATALADLPEPAQKAFSAAAGQGKIITVEKVTKGSVVSYEATINKAGRKSEIAVNADGSPKNQ